MLVADVLSAERWVNVMNLVFCKQPKTSLLLLESFDALPAWVAVRMLPLAMRAFHAIWQQLPSAPIMRIQEPCPYALR